MNEALSYTPDRALKPWDTESHIGKVREELKESWTLADKLLTVIDASTPLGLARWQELQARERELRTYTLTKRAVFRGTIIAHLALALLGALLWLLIFVIALWMRP